MSITERQLDRLEERIGEKLAARTATRTDYTEYANNPEGFAIEVLGFEPWSKQVEVLRSVLENKKTLSKGHHGAGKDAILAVVLLWATYAREMLSLAISATERQLIGQLWAEVSRLWDRADLPGELFVGQLRIGGERRIIGMTSGSTSNLTGWHNHRGSGVFVAISESQAEQVGTAAFDAAEGNTAGEGSRIVVVGNPVRPSGRFYDVSRKPTWNVITISALDHPNVIEGKTVIPGGPAPDWPEEMEAEFGTDSAFYQSRVLGEFPTEGTVDSLVSRAVLDAAFDRHDRGTGLEGWPLPVLALDVARSTARDENVAAIAQGPVVHRLERWRSRDLVATAARFLEVEASTRQAWHRNTGARAMRADPPVRALELIVDTPGIGGGVVDIIRDRGRKPVEYWGWNPAKDGKRFANLRAESYWTVRKLLEDGDAVLPRDGKLADELAAMEWSQDAKGRIAMLPKEDIRSQLGRSPDSADAVVMALAGSTGALRWKAHGIAVTPHGPRGGRAA